MSGLSYGYVPMSECKHDYVIWRGRYICAECGQEKNYGVEQRIRKLAQGDTGMLSKFWKKDNHTGTVEVCTCENCFSVRNAYARGYEDGYEDAMEDTYG